ncbi:hypothetical protein V9T40_003257 [Parthenolecanium corni]|uniref:HTH CENPB-type domain-containing protein n=1 Tax=Parthenolecanium corni TaxID=536013 RepID=A0AAN9Y7U4_9HEMI
MATKRRILTLREKVEVIKAIEQNKRTIKSVVADFSCGKTQIYKAIQEKEKILDEWNNGANPSRQRKKKIIHDDVDAKVWEWFVKTRAKNVHVSGVMVQEQAKLIAAKLGNSVFKASNGWLDCFKNRHRVAWKKIRSESKDVDMTIAEDLKARISDMINGYEPCDVNNFDETKYYCDIEEEKEVENINSSDDESHDDKDETVLSNREALNYVKQLTKFAATTGDNDLLNLIVQAQEIIEKKILQSHQKKITDFFQIIS